MADKKPSSPPKAPTRTERTRPKRDVVDAPVGEAGALDATVQSPVTETGLPVEDQIRKEWDPKKNGGLPTSVRTGAR